MPKLTAFTFQGGGARGAGSTAAALRRVISDGNEPTIITGESIGAAVALIAAVRGFADAVRMWGDGSINPGVIYAGWKPLRALGVLLGKTRGIYDMSPALDSLERLTSGLRIPASTLVIVTVTDLFTGRREDNLLTADTPMSSCVEKVYQSCLVPVAHGARDGRWADGGISASAPLEIPVRYGATKVDVFLTERLGTSSWSGGKPLDEAARAITVLRENLFLRDLEATERVNIAPTGSERRVTARLHEPEEIVGGWMDFKPETLRKWLAVKYRPWGLRQAILESHRRNGTLPPAWMNPPSQ